MGSDFKKIQKIMGEPDKKYKLHNVRIHLFLEIHTSNSDEKTHLLSQG